MPWIVLITGVPFVAAIAVLNLVGPVATAEFAVSANVSPGLPGLVSFCAAAVAQICLCLGVLFGIGRLFARIPVPDKRPYIWLGLVYGAAMFIALALMPAYGGVAGELTFRMGARLLEEAHPAWIASNAVGPTPLYLGYFVPSLLGSLTVIAAAATMYALVRHPIQAGENAGTASPLEVDYLLRTILYSMTLILVLSTLAASLFFHLPQSAIAGPDRAAFIAQAAEISLFWGVVYSLTLAATVLPAFVLVREGEGGRPQGGSAQPSDADPAEGPQIDRGTRRIELIVTVLAPMVTGPAASLIQGALITV